MTDIELLPFEYLRTLPAHCRGRIDARANVEHHTAQLQAEIEALRAEVELWRHKAAIHKYRRERLAEAINAYKSEWDNPVKDYLLRAKRRDEMFALLRDQE